MAGPSRIAHAQIARCVRVLALFTLADAMLSLFWGGASFGEGGVWGWGPGWVEVGRLGGAGSLLLPGWALLVLLWAHLGPRGRALARCACVGVAALCAVDGAEYYRLLAAGAIRTGVPVPLSAALAALLLAWGLRPPAPPGRRGPLRIAFGLLLDAAVAVAGLALLCVVFGATDYRRPADAIVVFGAGVKRDGTPSPTLAERTRSACRLWHDGLAPTLVFSGGHGSDMVVSEPESMAAFAQQLGVPREAMLLDGLGSNTAATVRNAAALAEQRGFGRLLMVSNDYHLLRIKLFCKRLGLRAYTVPCEDERPPRNALYSYGRELAGLLTYYFLPQVTGDAVGR